MIITILCSFVIGICAAYINATSFNHSFSSKLYLKKIPQKVAKFIILSVVGVYSCYIVSIFFPAILSCLLMKFDKILYALIEIIIFILNIVAFYFISKIIISKIYNAKLSKVIKKLKQTPLWNDMINTLNNYPQCPVYVCTDGIAVKKRPDENSFDYSVYDETIALGKIITIKDKVEIENNAHSIDEIHFVHVNQFESVCEIIKFSKYNLSNLEEKRIHTLAEIIQKANKHNKYISHAITKSYTIEELKSDNNGSSDSVIQTGNIYTVHPPTTGTSHYETKTIYSVIKYVAVYPEPQKPKKSKREPKSKEKSWL